MVIVILHSLGSRSQQLGPEESSDLRNHAVWTMEWLASMRNSHFGNIQAREVQHMLITLQEVTAIADTSEPVGHIDNCNLMMRSLPLHLK